MRMVSREIDKAEKPLPCPSSAPQYAPNLIAALKQQKSSIKDAPADPERAVREQRCRSRAAHSVEITADGWRKGEPAQVELIYDASQRDSAGLGEPPARRCSKTTRSAPARLRLLARGMSPGVIRPLVVADRDQSTAQTRSGTLFAMLPYFFILGAFHRRHGAGDRHHGRRARAPVARAAAGESRCRAGASCSASSARRVCSR